MMFAASNGMYQNICDDATKNGYLHILQYCCDEGLEWNEYKNIA